MHLRLSFPSLRRAPWAPSLRAAACLLGLVLVPGPVARAQTILGTAGHYAVMAGSTVTNNGVTTLTGDLGAANLAGSGSFVHTGTQVIPVGAQPRLDFTKAFDGLAAMTPTGNLSGSILGTSAGATVLTPGVYRFDSTAQLTGTLLLDAQHRTDAVWVFQIGSTFTTAAGAAVVFTNLAANSAATNGLFWQVGTTAVFGAGTTFEGNVLAGTTFDLGTGATIDHGRVLTGTGTVTLANNRIDFNAAGSGYSGGLAFDGNGNLVTAIPEPTTSALLAGAAMAAVVAVRRRRRCRGASDPRQE